MSRMFLAATVLAFGCAALGCRQGRAQELSSQVRLLYTGSLRMTPEHPETEPDCSRETVAFESSGYIVLDRDEHFARLDGFGCRIDLAKSAGTEFSASSQECVPDGDVNFKGVGIERLQLESFSANLNDKTSVWTAKVWRALPSGRVSYCFNLTSSIEQR